MREWIRNITEVVSVLALPLFAFLKVWPYLHLPQTACCPWLLPAFQLCDMKSNAFPPTLNWDSHREFSD